jgi:hypothetical protein
MSMTPYYEVWFFESWLNCYEVNHIWALQKYIGVFWKNMNNLQIQTFFNMNIFKSEHYSNLNIFKLKHFSKKKEINCTPSDQIFFISVSCIKLSDNFLDRWECVLFSRCSPWQTSCRRGAMPLAHEPAWVPTAAGAQPRRYPLPHTSSPTTSSLLRLANLTTAPDNIPPKAEEGAVAAGINGKGCLRWTFHHRHHRHHHCRG